MNDALIAAIRSRAKAKHIGIKKLMSDAGLDPGYIYKLKQIPSPGIDSLRKIAKELDCSVEELTGASKGMAGLSLKSRAKPSEWTRRDSQIHTGASFNDRDKAATLYEIDELDVRAQAGGGAMVDSEQKVGSWAIPREVIRGQTRAPADVLKIITVIGDSMQPTLMPGQRIMVDLEDTIPSPPGLFVVWDGLGLVVKRLFVLPHSEPVTVELLSDNKSYPPYERTLEEAHVRGRVVGFWHWT